MVQSLPDRRKAPVVTFEQFVRSHRSQLILIPKLYWRSLYEKISFNIYDLYKNIQVETKKITYPNYVEKQVTARVTNKNGLKQNDPQNIFLIQHLIHFYASEGRELIKEMIVKRDPLLSYLKRLMDVNDTDACSFMNNILHESWKYVLPFQLQTKGNKKSLPIWSITEHIGMAIKHSFDPNFQMVTFHHLNMKRVYSVIFPIKPLINYGEEVTRDYTYFEKIDYDRIKLNAQKQQEYFEQEIGVQDITHWSLEDERKLLKNTLLIPWCPEKLIDYLELDILYQQHEPSTFEFFDKRLYEQPYNMMRFEPKHLKNQMKFLRQIKVYCEDKHVINNLTDSRYVFVNNTSMADIWWLTEYFFNFSKMYIESPNTLINQFPLSHLLNEKDVLPVLCRRQVDKYKGNIDPFTLSSSPSWLPTTFNLTTELVKFVSYFTAREKKNKNNTWIIKPTNQTKSADIFITDNLAAIIRLRSCFDRVACKYIDNPVLFYREDLRTQVKFELKYFVVLTSVLPLKLFVHKAFQIDCANKKFDLGKSYSQEVHLTDMSCFNDQVKRLDIDHIEFIQKFNFQYRHTNFDFDKLDNQVMESIKELFELCTEKFPFSAINHNVTSSAFYGVDVLLSWIDFPMVWMPRSIQPNIIDVNLNPSCEIICQKFSNFYNDLFDLMFLNNEKNCNFRAI